MNIRKARILSLDLHLGRRDWYTLEECRQAFDRLHRSQPEKQNKLILRSDRQSAQVIWDNIATLPPQVDLSK